MSEHTLCSVQGRLKPSRGGRASEVAGSTSVVVVMLFTATRLLLGSDMVKLIAGFVVSRLS